nr:fanconi anemia group I protein [Tanacetum cinerariifolium]
MSTTANHNAPPQELTPNDIIRLAQYHTTTPIHPNLLTPSSHQTLISHLHTLPPETINQYTTSLLTLLTPSPDPEHQPLITSIITTYITLHKTNKIPHNPLSLKTLHLFINYLDNIPVSALHSLTDLIVASFINVNENELQLLELLPKCLDVLSKCDDTGLKYVNEVFDKVLECEWDGVLLRKLVGIIREFGFIDKAKGRMFVDKVFDEMCKVELQDLPGLVYQLLVLASKGFFKREVVEGIVRFFGGFGMDKGGRLGVVREVEGTVLLHVNFAVKQDPSLGMEVMGIVRAGGRVVDHFVVGLLLSIARVRRYGESAMGTLNTALSTVYKDYKFSRQCKWLPGSLKEEYLQNASLTEKAVLRAVNESNFGREHIVPSIVQLGFVLLESTDELSHKELGNTGLMGSQELGIQMLKSLFEVHDMSRNEIIEQCKFRILSLKPDQSLAIIRLLGNLVQNHPYPMLEYVSHLKELLDYFSFMQSKVASRLINVLLPLIKFSHSLQDYIILVVRKAMFRQEDQIRLAAAGAIINLIHAEKQSKQSRLSSYQESSSQASSSQAHEIPLGISGDLFKELSGLLQRCLYQQAKVKEVTYRGLLKLVLVDPLTAGTVFDFLLPHFLKFYTEDGKLSISQCIKKDNGKVCIVEPLDELLSCVSWIILLQPQTKSDVRSDSWASLGFSLTQDSQQAGGTHSGESFSRALATIRKLLRNENLEGLLGEAKDAGPTPQGERHGSSGQILSGVIEVILNTVATELEKATNDKKIELIKEFVDLVDLYESLDTSATTAQTTGTKKGITQSTALDPTYKNEADNLKSSAEKSSFLATRSIYQLFQTLFELFKHDTAASQVRSQTSTKLPNQHCKLCHFVLNATLRQMKSYSYLAKDDPLKALIYGDIKVLGPPVLKLIWLLMQADKKKNEAKGKKDNEDGKGLLLLALMCLKELLTVCSQSPDEMREIEDMLSKSVVEDASQDMHVNESEREELFITKTLKPLLSKLLHAKFFHEVEILCDISKMSGCNIIGTWATHMCETSDVANPKIAKSVVTLALSCTQAPNDLVTARDMALELVKVTGSLLTESELAKSEIYGIINRSTDTVTASVFLQYAESVITDMDRLSITLKTCFTRAYKDGKQNQYFVLEETLYQRAEAVVELLSSFVVMHLKDPQAEHLLRLAAKLYKTLARISKFHIAPKGCKQIIPSLKCQKLVEVTCKQLTAPLYTFVDYMQKNKKDSRPSKGMINKIKRENKCIPDLIFQIEDYEKYLILLSKASKINLLRHAKRSTARDFRIRDEQKNPQQEAPNQEPREDNEAAPQCDSVQDCEDAEDASERVLSPETGSPLVAGDSEDDNMIPSAKTSSPERVLSPETGSPLVADDSEDDNMIPSAKRTRILYNSDDEA